ncbi:hypothetical protein [Polyangium jinanense]|uniref:Lipoprotein n=1 Tax=Polyangium jinanense TaxID=2829994 RepID=A0A9X3XEI8_9BACT|nr:hypothetical protein [Polyangium jinanense]MDC3958432.1 hypothetical protein [Polyangium jinanense]MDC3987985.1 hypothetical protein [Polyangium jinanense]
MGTRNRRFAALIAPVAILALAACEKTPEPPPSGAPDKARPAPAAPAGSTSPGAAAPQRKGPTDVAYDVPEGWQKAENPSPMRKATFKIPRAEGDAEDAEMSVSQAGGTVDQNVQRWSGQFERGKEDTTSRQDRKIGELSVTVVEIHGTFSGGMGMPGAAPAGPKPKWALLGAIVETDGALTFFKLTGPEKTVTAAKPAFEKFVESLRAK